MQYIATIKNKQGEVVKVLPTRTEYLERLRKILKEKGWTISLKVNKQSIISEEPDISDIIET